MADLRERMAVAACPNPECHQIGCRGNGDGTYSNICLAAADRCLAASGRAELVELVRRCMNLIDEVVDDSEGRYPRPNVGCIECTAGTVPDRLNTGLCAYHAARALLARESACCALSPLP